LEFQRALKCDNGQVNDRLGKARQTIKSDDDGRRKADALSKVAKEIRLHFRHVEAQRRKPTDNQRTELAG
jgi:hypothetical protein